VQVEGAVDGTVPLPPQPEPVQGCGCGCGEELAGTEGAGEVAGAGEREGEGESPVHAAADVAPTTEEDVPAGHATQAEAPAGAYVPAGQSAQAAAPNWPEKEPAAQSVQEVVDAFAPEDCQ